MIEPALFNKSLVISILVFIAFVVIFIPSIKKATTKK